MMLASKLRHEKFNSGLRMSLSDTEGYSQTIGPTEHVAIEDSSSVNPEYTAASYMQYPSSNNLEPPDIMGEHTFRITR